MKKKGMGLGQGGRFEKLEGELGKRKGVKHPAALAAWIGMHRHSKAQMARWSAGGRRRGK